MVVVDAALNSLMAATKIEQAANFALMIKQQAEAAMNAYQQLQSLVKQGEAVAQNLKGFKNVRSWDEFMAWHNRQLYLEQQAERKFMNTGIQIGGKKVKLTDLKDIREVGAHVKDTYWEYWDREFTEEQRKSLWLKLGMSPGAYAYQKTWQTRLEAGQTKFLGAADQVNEDNMKANEADAAKKERLASDDIGANELAAIQADTMIDMARQQRDAAADEAAWRQYQIDKDMAETPVAEPPQVSEAWNVDNSGSITNKK
jgi:hypothetical protein